MKTLIILLVLIALAYFGYEMAGWIGVLAAAVVYFIAGGRVQKYMAENIGDDSEARPGEYESALLGDVGASDEHPFLRTQRLAGRALGSEFLQKVGGGAVVDWSDVFLEADKVSGRAVAEYVASGCDDSIDELLPLARKAMREGCEERVRMMMPIVVLEVSHNGRPAFVHSGHLDRLVERGVVSV